MKHPPIHGNKDDVTILSYRLLTAKDCIAPAGPLVTAQHQVQPQHLHCIAAPLTSAVEACMSQQLSKLQSSQTTSGLDSTLGPGRDSPGDPHAPLSVQSMDSTAVMALFGCAGHVLRCQSKAHAKATAAGVASTHAGNPAQQPAVDQGPLALNAGCHSDSIDVGQAVDTHKLMDRDGNGPDSGCPWVMSSLPQQLAGLTGVLSRPWRLQSDQHHADPDRYNIWRSDRRRQHVCHSGLTISLLIFPV